MRARASARPGVGGLWCWWMPRGRSWTTRRSRSLLHLCEERGRAGRVHAQEGEGRDEKGRTPRTGKTRVGTRLWQAPTCCSTRRSERARLVTIRTLSLSSSTTTCPSSQRPRHSSCRIPQVSQPISIVSSCLFLSLPLFRPFTVSYTISTPLVLLTPCLQCPRLSRMPSSKPSASPTSTPRFLLCPTPPGQSYLGQVQ